MPHNKFTPDTIVYIDGAAYRPMGYQDDRLLFIHLQKGGAYKCPDADGTLGLPTDADFSQLMLENRVVLQTAPSKHPVRYYNDTAQWVMDQAIELDPTVERKKALVDMLDAAGVANGDKAIERHLHKHWTQALVDKYGDHEKPRTIRRWRAERGYVGNRQPRALVDMRGLCPKNSRSPEIAAQIEWKHALAHYAEKSSVKATHDAYKTELESVNEGSHPLYPKPEKPFKIVDERTIRRRIEAIEMRATTEAQKGKAAAKQDWDGGGSPLVADFAMHYVQIDHTWIDAFVVDDDCEMVLGRPWLTLAIDVFSRAIVGYVISFIPPSTWTTGEILRRIVSPKRVPNHFLEKYPILQDLRGKPTELILDNAVEFRSKTMEAAARGAGFNIRFCPIEAPRYRAVVERVNQTVNKLITDDIPGRVLSLAETRRLGVSGEKTACVLMLELEAIANWRIAEYNTSPHDGLNGRQPALVFQENANRYGINNFTDFELFRLDTMEIETNAQLSNSGVKAFSGLRYAGAREVRELLDDLVPLEGRRQRRDAATATIDYRYDPADISCIYVWNRKTRKWVKLMCMDERYAKGMPIWFHEAVRKKAETDALAFNTEDDRVKARSILIAAIKAISPEAKAKARLEVARLYEIPRIRAITGNIIHLHTPTTHNVSLAEFLANDRAEETALDMEILSPRTPNSPKRETNQNLTERRQAQAGGRSTAAQQKAAQDAAARNSGVNADQTAIAPRRRGIGQK